MPFVCANIFTIMLIPPVICYWFVPGYVNKRYLQNHRRRKIEIQKNLKVRSIHRESYIVYPVYMLYIGANTALAVDFIGLKCIALARMPVLGWDGKD